MKSSISVENAKQMINDKLSHFFGVTPEDATEEQYYKAVAMIVRDDLAAKKQRISPYCKRPGFQKDLLSLHGIPYGAFA